MRISDWSSDVCSSDLILRLEGHAPGAVLVGKVAPGAAVAEEAAVLVEQRHAADRPVLTVAARGHVDIAEFTKRPVRAQVGQVGLPFLGIGVAGADFLAGLAEGAARSEAHTSELQYLMRISYADFFLN